MTENVSCDEFVEGINTMKDPFFEQQALGITLLALYVSAIALGTVGNLFVILSVVRNPTMRNFRNFFIVNLGVSDLILCTVTTPFNMVLTFNNYQPFDYLTCKFVCTFQGINIFVSTLSITAIGFDRYVLVLFPTQLNFQHTLVICMIAGVWLLSILIVSPFFFVTYARYTFQEERFLATKYYDLLQDCGLYDWLLSLHVCSEDDAVWEVMPLGRRSYTLMIFAMQYLLPLVSLCFVYINIWLRMRARMLRGPASRVADPHRRQSMNGRQRRTNMLLILIVLTFAISWLPHNVMTTLSNFGVISHHTAWFAICTLWAMLSACANPIIYGLFNHNFRVEFINIVRDMGCTKLYHFITNRANPHQLTPLTGNHPPVQTLAKVGYGTVENTAVSHQL